MYGVFVWCIFAFVVLGFFSIYLFTLAALGLSWGMWDLRFGMWTLSCSIPDLVPQPQESNLGPLHWECGVLATEPPGKSLDLFFKLK